MDPYETANIFDLVFTIARSLISFSKIFFNFMTTPLSITFTEFAFPNSYLLNEFIKTAIGTLSPYTPLDILAGGGFMVIMIFIIIKKVVPLA